MIPTFVGMFWVMRHVIPLIKLRNPEAENCKYGGMKIFAVDSPVADAELKCGGPFAG
jgi:hypothetical protein